MSNPEKKDIFAVIILGVVISLAYLNTLPNSFIFDDFHMIVRNAYIKDPKYFPLFFKGDVTSWPIFRGMYRPILMLSFAFNYYFGGLRPEGYHIINILIHFLNAVLLYLLLKLFLKDLKFILRLGITLIFGLHPINTEAVTYISSRSDLLSTLFILTSLYFYIRSKETKRPSLYLGSVGLYPFALLTKETGLVLLGLILAVEFFYTRNFLKNFKSVFLRLLPFILLTFAYLVLIKIVFGNVFGLFGKVEPSVFPVRPFLANILTQSAVSFFYLYLFFYPFNLCIDHNFPIITQLSNPLGTGSLVLLLVLITLCLFLKRRIKPIVGLACLWYFISLSPKFYARLNLVAAEHHAYLPFFSLYFLLGFLLTRLEISPAQRGITGFLKGLIQWKINKIYLRQAFFFILGLFFILTVSRNFQWRTECTLWQATLKVNPKSGIAKGSIWMCLADTDPLESKRYLEEAAANSSCFEATRIISQLNLAFHYAYFQNQPEEGIRILKENETYLRKKHPIAYFRTLGLIYLKAGKEKEGVAILEHVIKNSPHDAEIKSTLGSVYLHTFSNREKAKEYFQSAILDRPDLAWAHFGLGAVLEKEDLNKAIRAYEEGLRFKPDAPDVYFRLGFLYAKRLSSSKAEWYFKRTIELKPDFSPAYYNLCILYLSLPQPNFELAQEYFNHAKALGYKVDPEIEEILRKKEIPVAKESCPSCQ